MRLLIDMHALLWFCEGSSMLSPKARAAMEDDANERFSGVSLRGQSAHGNIFEICMESGLCDSRKEA
jgi:hypothetical protein